MPATATMFSSADACHLADISYRRLDYWCRIGTIAPEQAHAAGSGSRRRWTAQQVAVLAVIGHVGGFVRVSELDQLAAMLMDWDTATWDRTVLLIAANQVWLADEDGAPAVGTYVNLGVVLAKVRSRHATR